MSLPPWRSPLARALHRNRSLAYSRYLQLATVRPDGRPANRTVVFRGFLDDSDRLKFITDRRSAKIDQIAEQSWGEICWYFPNTREQFRLLGPLTLVTADDSNDWLAKARQQQWQELSNSARSQFAWPEPGQPKQSAAAFDLPAADPVHPLPNFCLLLLEPVDVDHLELRGDPQNRYLYSRAGAAETQNIQWTVQSVNP